MTLQEPQPNPDSRKSSSEQSIATLLKLAGERVQPDIAAMSKARAAAHASWRLAVKKNWFITRKRRFTTFFLGGALAATIVAVVLVIGMHAVPAQVVEVGRFARIEGQVNRIDHRKAVPLRDNAVLMSGDVVETDAGRVAINIGALSLRLDRDTRLIAMSAQDVRLDHGRLYVDSQSINSPVVLRIHTSTGLVQHEGTQFQVIATQDVTQVEVREGRVRVEHVNTRQQAVQQIEIGAGQAVTMDSQQLGRVRPQAVYGEQWNWVADIAPEFDIDGRPLTEYLTWVAREHGWQLRYASTDLERTARDIRLHGRLPGDAVRQQLDNVGLITGTYLNVEHGVLTISASMAGE